MYVGLEDGFDGEGFVSDDFLLDVEDRDVLRDGDFSQSHRTEECRLSDSVSSDQSVSTVAKDFSLVPARKERRTDRPEARLSVAFERIRSEPKETSIDSRAISFDFPFEALASCNGLTSKKSSS